MDRVEVVGNAQHVAAQARRGMRPGVPLPVALHVSTHGATALLMLSLCLCRFAFFELLLSFGRAADAVVLLDDCHCATKYIRPRCFLFLAETAHIFWGIVVQCIIAAMYLTVIGSGLYAMLGTWRRGLRTA